jgi:predicted acetylornithine/succinylornithine family transaminase
MEEIQPQSSPSLKEQAIQDLEKQYLVPTYARYPVVIERGKGCWVYDVNGKRYLDFLAGLAVNALGHAHPRIVKVIREQAGKAFHVSNLYYHPYQGRLAERLAKLAGLDRVFFCNSGTEAIEAALKMARVYSAGQPEKHQILSLDNSFHGRTFGALSATGQKQYRTPFHPLLPGVEFVRFDDAGDLRAHVTDRTSAILIEAVQGEGGIFELSPEFLRTAEELARKHHALLILDEIQCGLGRTGAYFTFQRAGIRPDVVVVAKPLAAGLPLGAVIAREEVAQTLGAGMHGTTFGGGPLACRVALEFLDVLEQENLLEHVNKVGAAFYAGLARLQTRFPFVKAVRGRGLMLALDLEFPARQIVLDAIQAGLLINSTHDTVLRFLPPFIVTEEQVNRGLRILQKVLAKAVPPP